MPSVADDSDEILALKFTALHGELVETMDGKSVAKVLRRQRQLINKKMLNKLDKVVEGKDYNRQLLCLVHRSNRMRRYVEFRAALAASHQAALVSRLDETGKHTD